MSRIFLIVSITALVAFVVGLFDPGRAIFWSEKKDKIQLVVYVVIAVVCGVVWWLVRP